MLETIRTRRSSRGQSLVEFAIVLPIFVTIVGAVIQFGVIFWGQNSLTQVARDTGRFAATLQQCTSDTAIVAKANSLAGGADLVGYTAGSWTSANVVVTWPGTDPCPPLNNQQVRWVRVVITHTVPVFFPWLPGNGVLTASVDFRMEPAP